MRDHIDARRRSANSARSILPLVTVIALIATLSIVVSLSSGCAEKTVTVQTGERVVCTYGEEVSSTVHAVKVPADEANKYSVRTKRIKCDRHAQLEALYGEAQNAISKGDLATAEKKLAQVVASDTSFASAASQLADIKSGRKPAVDRATTGSTAPSSGDAGAGE